MGRIREWLTGSQRSADSGDNTNTGMTVPSRSAALGHVSVAEAFGLSMVYRAIQIHAISAKQLSIETTRYGRRLDDHPLTRKPDPDSTRSSWIEQLVVSMASTGNGYCEIIRDAFGQAIALPVMNPLDVRIRSNRAGHVTGYAYQGRELQKRDVMHVTLLRIPGSAYGLGPVQAAQPDLRGAISTRDYAAAWLDDSGVPTGILKTDQNLNAQTAGEAKTRWNTDAGQKNGVVVLGSGLDYRPIFLSPKDVQFIESQQFSVTQIARLFGTPASLMLAAVEGNSQSYSNVEQDWLAYVRFTLMGYLTEIEDALSELLPGARRARFNIEALLRADTTTRYQSYATAIDKGFMTVAEVREIEGLAPLDEPAAAAAPERAADLGELHQIRQKEISE
ncbi:portal protein [Microbacterium phage Efeko]|uniref:Portal protein n=1 Tax=Microbacterium phage Efeko TaxID=2315704 RepID=A0A386KLF4_9CAUD|nr:portal protein [Microbacterium phage Efeko]AYD86252.2 portal protein [Microbacterium phage Efeko]